MAPEPLRVVAQDTDVPDTELLMFVQVVPLSADAQSCSADAEPEAAAKAAERVALMVCEPVLVMPSVELDPVSAESPSALMVTTGAVASTVIAWLAVVPTLPAVSITLT